jgi:hypothetical protein
MCGSQTRPTGNASELIGPVEDLLDRALSLPAAERRAFAERACGTDAALPLSRGHLGVIPVQQPAQTTEH